VRDHPFVDGNKRAGLAALLAFLGLNSHRLDADARELEKVVRGVAAGKTTKAEVAVFIQRHMRPRRYS
jgi:death-on-curing protein